MSKKTLFQEAQDVISRTISEISSVNVSFEYDQSEIEIDESSNTIKIPAVTRELNEEEICRVRGSVDREVASLMYRDSTVDTDNKVEKLIFEGLEEARVQKKLGNMLSGCGRNLRKYRRKIIQDSLDSSDKSTQIQMFFYDLIFDTDPDLIDQYLPPQLKQGLKAKEQEIKNILNRELNSTKDSLQAAQKIRDLLFPEPPETPNQQSGGGEDESDKEKDDSSNQSQEQQKDQNEENQEDQENQDQKNQEEQDNQEKQEEQGESDDDKTDDSENTESEESKDSESENSESDESKSEESENSNEENEENEEESDKEDSDKSEEEQENNQGENSDTEEDEKSDTEENDKNEDSNEDSKAKDSQQSESDENQSDENDSSDEKEDENGNSENSEQNNNSPENDSDETGDSNGKGRGKQEEDEIDGNDEKESDKSPQKTEKSGQGGGNQASESSETEKQDTKELNLDEEDINPENAFNRERDYSKNLKNLRKSDVRDYSKLPDWDKVVSIKEYVDTFNMDESDINLKEEIKREAGVLSSKLWNEFKAKKRVFNRNQPKGRVDDRSIWKAQAGSENIFKRRTEDRDFNTATYITIDNSQSMKVNTIEGGKHVGYKTDKDVETRFMATMKWAGIFASCFDQINIPNAVSSWTQMDNKMRNKLLTHREKTKWKNTVRSINPTPERGFPIIHNVWKNFDQKFMEVVQYWNRLYTKNLPPSPHGSGKCFTPDGEGLEFAANQLLKRPEEKKVLIVLLDGQSLVSSPSGRYSDTASKYLEKVIKETQKKGIYTLGVGIGVNNNEDRFDWFKEVNSKKGLVEKVYPEISKMIKEGLQSLK